MIAVAAVENNFIIALRFPSAKKESDIYTFRNIPNPCIPLRIRARAKGMAGFNCNQNF